MALPLTKNEKVLVWSNSKEDWFPGSVTEVLLEERIIDGHRFERGSVQVSSAAGTKWVHQPDLARCVRRRYEKGEKVEVWSNSKEDWLPDGVVLAVLDEDTEVEGKLRPAGSVQVRAGRGTKWVGPSDAQSDLRRSFVVAVVEPPPTPLPAAVVPLGPAAPPAWDTVWAFWDIENSTPETLEVQDAACAIQEFLGSKGYGGVGVHLTLAAFFPQHLAAKEGFGAAFVKELDRASVLQILCTNKREAADRKLEQFFKLVSRQDRAGTAFVFITSDGDFQATLKEAKDRGLHAALLHNCERGSSNEKCLTQHVARSFRWPEVEAFHGRSLRRRTPGVARAHRPTSRGRAASVPPVRPAREAEKVVGTVLNWTTEKGFGFLKPDGSDDEENVFCHITQVRGFPGSLRVGQRVRFIQHFRPGEKGPQASDVELL